MRMYRAFAVKLFGRRYEKLKRTLPVYLIVFWGLHLAGGRIRIAPFILYLMAGTFTAGVMWQSLFSEEHAASLKNMLMLPFEERELVFSYVASLGAYTLLIRTAGLLAVVFAVSSWKGTEVLGSLLCAIDAVLMTACVYARKKYLGLDLLWAGAAIAAIFLLWDKPAFFFVTLGNGLLAIFLLGRADPYSFYLQTAKRKRTVKASRRCFLWRYLFRYLMAHKNYLTNTVVLWGVACVLPVFFRQLESRFALPVGFAILSLNTPIGILLSCDPALQQAVRFLPSQKKAFGVPYCLFIFLCNVTADVIFLGSFWMRGGGVDGMTFLTAILFASQSAICSVLLEWFFPVRGWKIESDLWHHPRKYVVPVIMLLLAGLVSTLPGFLYLFMALVLLEIFVLLYFCWK